MTPGSTGTRVEKDSQVGVVGYEINFNRYFYRYKPPRPLEAIEADIREIEKDIVRMLAEVTEAWQGGIRSSTGEAGRLLSGRRRVTFPRYL